MERQGVESRVNGIVDLGVESLAEFVKGIVAMLAFGVVSIAWLALWAAGLGVLFVVALAVVKWAFGVVF